MGGRNIFIFIRKHVLTVAGSFSVHYLLCGPIEVSHRSLLNSPLILILFEQMPRPDGLVDIGLGYVLIEALLRHLHQDSHGRCVATFLSRLLNSFLINNRQLFRQR